MLIPSRWAKVVVPCQKYHDIFANTALLPTCEGFSGRNGSLPPTLTRRSCAPVRGCRTCNHSNHRRPRRRPWCCAENRAGRPAPSGLWSSLSDTPEGEKQNKVGLPDQLPVLSKCFHAADPLYTNLQPPFYKYTHLYSEHTTFLSYEFIWSNSSFSPHFHLMFCWLFVLHKWILQVLETWRL